MLRKEKITIKDVARAAGVSTQTVSRVLNERLDVSTETRTHVQEVIESMGYSPNAFARNLSRGHSNTLGVIGYGLVYYGTSSVLTGIESKANELGFSLTLSLIDHVEPSKVDRVVYDFLSRRVEGIIWAVPSDITAFDWLADRFAKIQTPLIFINKGPNGSDHVTALDNRLGGKLATEHLLRQGYQRIGIITGPSTWWEAQERSNGWREVVKAAGYADADIYNLLVEGDWNAPSGEAGLQTLIERNPDMDAVFSSNDQMALGALQTARRLELRIPDDLGIVGFDDIPEAAYFYPSLTTIRQDMRRLGAMAVEQMNVLIETKNEGGSLEPETLWLEPELIVRKSSVRQREYANEAP